MVSFEFEYEIIANNDTAINVVLKNDSGKEIDRHNHVAVNNSHEDENVSETREMLLQRNGLTGGDFR